MATDYDAPRKTDEELNEDSIEELKSRRVDKTSSSVDVDETEQAEGFELPGADLSGEELSVRALPKQADGSPQPEALAAAIEHGFCIVRWHLLDNG